MKIDKGKKILPAQQTEEQYRKLKHDIHSLNKKYEKQNRDSSGSLERDGDENLDKIISQILEGDKNKTQSSAAMPFDVAKQNSGDSSINLSRSRKSGPKTSRDGSRERSESPSSPQQDYQNQVMPTSLESDLDTILETD